MTAFLYCANQNRLAHRQPGRGATLRDLLSGGLHAAIALGFLLLASGLLLPHDGPATPAATLPAQAGALPADPPDPAPADAGATTPAEAAALAALAPAAGDPGVDLTAEAGRRVASPVPYLRRPLSPGAAVTVRAVRDTDPRLRREDSLLLTGQPLTTTATRRSAQRYLAGAAQGHAFARYNLARALAAGRGLPRDIRQAAAQFRLAAEAGYVQAILRLAELHLAGEGVSRDLSAAATWYYLASALDSEAGRRGRALIVARLDPQRRDMARNHAVEIRETMPPVDVASRRQQATRFIDAASSGDIDDVRRLLRQGVDANAVDQFGRTGLINAAWRGHTEIVALLAESGVDIDATDDDGRTALMWSAINGHDATVDRLLGYAAYVDAVDGQGLTPLMRAAWNGHAGIVRLLMAHGADPRLRDHSGKTALDRARSQNDRAVMTLLLAAVG